MSVFVIIKQQDSFVLSVTRVVISFCLRLDWRVLALCDKNFSNVMFLRVWPDVCETLQASVQVINTGLWF